MEFCAGGDLIDRLECRLGEKPLGELTMLRFHESLCHALHHVHNCGVLHRDLKSSNIFVSRNDREVKLGDFGLAASGLSPRRLSGSPRRMSRCGTASEPRAPGHSNLPVPRVWRRRRAQHLHAHCVLCARAVYMSPEVADRKPYGAASDTYGLGCVLLEMLVRHQARLPPGGRVPQPARWPQQELKLTARARVRLVAVARASAV